MSKLDDLAQTIADGIEVGLKRPPQRDLRWTTEEMMALARSAVTKIDKHGRHGTIDVKLDEIEAMAGALILTGVLIPAPDLETPPETPVFKTRRKT